MRKIAGVGPGSAVPGDVGIAAAHSLPRSEGEVTAISSTTSSWPNNPCTRHYPAHWSIAAAQTCTVAQQPIEQQHHGGQRMNTVRLRACFGFLRELAAISRISPSNRLRRANV